MAGKIRWKIRGFVALRKEPGVLADLERRARDIARAANQSSPGYIPTAQIGKRRSRASVITGDAESRVDNAKNQTLLRSLDAGS